MTTIELCVVLSVVACAYLGYRLGAPFGIIGQVIGTVVGAASYFLIAKVLGGAVDKYLRHGKNRRE